MSKIQVGLDHERLIKSLDVSYPKLDIRNSNCADFNLTEREMFFKLGQRSVIENLLAKLDLVKSKLKEDM